MGNVAEKIHNLIIDLISEHFMLAYSFCWMIASYHVSYELWQFPLLFQELFLLCLGPAVSCSVTNRQRKAPNHRQNSTPRVPVFVSTEHQSSAVQRGDNTTCKQNFYFPVIFIEIDLLLIKFTVLFQVLKSPTGWSARPILTTYQLFHRRLPA